MEDSNYLWPHIHESRDFGTLAYSCMTIKTGLHTIFGIIRFILFVETYKLRREQTNRRVCRKYAQRWMIKNTSKSNYLMSDWEKSTSRRKSRLLAWRLLELLSERRPRVRIVFLRMRSENTENIQNVTLPQFLANVNVSERELIAICCRSSICLSSVCNARAPYFT